MKKKQSMAQEASPEDVHEQQHTLSSRRDFLGRVKGWSALVIGGTALGKVGMSTGCNDESYSAYCDAYYDCSDYRDYCDAYGDTPPLHCDASDADSEYSEYSEYAVYSAYSAYSDKPNLYLYPTEPTHVRVSLGLNYPCRIEKSDPEYGEGWDVMVEPNGLIDGKHTYLFYEAGIPERYSMERGWSVAKAELSPFLREILWAYGLNNAETDDFLEYWMVNLPPAPFYTVSPITDLKELDALVSLTIDPQPDTLFRLWMVVSPESERRELPRPEVDRLRRSGFTAVEWGVVLDWSQAMSK